MLFCNRCSLSGIRKIFESTDGDQGYVCPNCGMDESGLIEVCECGWLAKHNKTKCRPSPHPGRAYGKFEQ